MSLKQMLNEQPFTIEPPSSSKTESLIQELTEKITALTSNNSEKDLTIAELQSIATMQQEQIELLTERASRLDEIEKSNEILNEKISAAQALRDRAVQEARAAEERVEYARRAAQESEERKRKADITQYEAKRAARETQEAARETQEAARRSQTRYKALFIGQLIFTTLLAVLMAWGKRSVLQELGRWWTDRAGDVVIVGHGIGEVFVWAVKLLARWGVPGLWPYVIASVLAVGLLVGLYFIGKRVRTALIDTAKRIKGQYRDGVFKAAITVDIVLGLFYICLWCYTPLRAIWPFNIFSLWLLLSVIGVTAWNFREFKGGMRT